MSIIKALFIGIVQGLSEFLPISSTAHMTIVAKIFGSDLTKNPQQWTAFMAIVQLGTLVSLLVFFRKEILSLLSTTLNVNPNFIKGEDRIQNKRLLLQIIFGSFPIFILGYIFEDIIEGTITKSNVVIGIMLISVGILMFITDYISSKQKTISQLSYLDAILIGFAQALALIPGVSRSGSTISIGLALGLKRETAAYFSFLLSIPAVFISGVYELTKNFGLFSMDFFIPTFVAVVTAFIFGLWSIKFLLHYLRNHSTLIFVVYRITIGFGLLLFLGK